MAFWINDKAGVAYESTEAGPAKWRPDDNDFSVIMSSAEMDVFMFPRRRVSADEAEAFARAIAKVSISWSYRFDYDGNRRY